MRQSSISPQTFEHVKSDPVEAAHGLFGMDVEVGKGGAGLEELWGSEGSAPDQGQTISQQAETALRDSLPISQLVPCVRGSQCPQGS